MADWDRKELWRKFGKDFMVEVSRHEVKTEASSCYDSEGPHRWCVYAYIYPKHPHFAAFTGADMWQDAAARLPFHWGCSYLRYHYEANGTPASVQVGADYNHLHDWHFTQCASKEDAYEVFRDAEELFDTLSQMAIREPA